MHLLPDWAENCELRVAVAPIRKSTLHARATVSGVVLIGLSHVSCGETDFRIFRTDALQLALKRAKVIGVR